MSDTFTRADIPPAPTACAEGVAWLDTHWPEGRETWTVREALEAGCDLSHALWALALRENNRRLLVTFACDCAERVLPHFEEHYPNDTRPRSAIETTRAWLRGEAMIDDIKAAYAAYAAAYILNRFAPYSAAALAANSAYANAYAASYAASYAAYAAYANAAAERAWQRARLVQMLAHQAMGGSG